MGINKNGVIYSSEKKVARVVYNSKGLWTIWSGGRVKSFQGVDLQLFAVPYTGNEGFDAGTLVRGKIIELLPYMENLFNNNFNKISYSIVKTKKLYKLKKLVRYQFLIPLRIYNNISDKSNNQFLSEIKRNRDYLTHIDSINLEFFNGGNGQLLHDTLRFARALNKKVNCSWSLKRLNAEHNDWSQEIVETLYKGDGTPLTIDDRFIEFENFSKFKLLKTVDELFCEGTLQRHCVATYTPQVNAGRSAIYHVNGYTLELAPSYSNNGVRVAQFRGVGNEGAPSSLSNEVDVMVKAFNEEMNNKVNPTETNLTKRLDDIVDLFDLEYLGN